MGKTKKIGNQERKKVETDRNRDKEAKEGGLNSPK